MTVKRERAFFFHYNKPASRKHGYPILTFHYAGKCLLTKELIINVPTYTHVRKTQPHIVVKGKARGFYFVQDAAGIIHTSIEVNKH